ncbi:bifunctional metallophosphatase/5'-nucleotidase [Streptomyces californicus]
MVGASPLLSGLFHDEPTIEALNKLDLDVTAVGNHEFDEGATELARLQNGGCHPVEGCYEKGKKFKGADFPYLAANVTKEKTGKPSLKPYTVWKKNGVKIGFIGVTLEGTPDIVTASGVKGLQVPRRGRDDQQVRPRAGPQGRQVDRGAGPRGRGPGLRPRTTTTATAPGAGDGVSGPIADIAKGVTPKVEALVTGHTHAAYVCADPGPGGQAAHGHLGRVVRPPVHGHDADVRPPHG